MFIYDSIYSILTMCPNEGTTSY